MLTAPGVTGSSAFVERESVSWRRSVTPPAYGRALPWSTRSADGLRDIAMPHCPSKLMGNVALLCESGSDSLDEHREALADPDAQGGEAAASLLPRHPAQQRHRQPGAAAAERMPEGDRPAVGVDGVDVEAEPVDAGKYLRCERLVDLDGVEIVGGPAGPRKRLLGRRHRPEAHQVRGHARAGAGDDPCPWLEVVATYGVLARDDDRGGSVRQW